MYDALSHEVAHHVYEKLTDTQRVTWLNVRTEEDQIISDYLKDLAIVNNSTPPPDEDFCESFRYFIMYRDVLKDQASKRFDYINALFHSSKE